MQRRDSKSTAISMSPQSLSAFVIRHQKIFLVILGAVLYIAFLGLRDLWYPDELDIAEVARAMFLSGDWVIPRRMGAIWVDYPPMLYWAGNISAHLFNGMSAFTLRLPNALAAIGTVVITSAVGKRWFNSETGFWAGFALLTFLSFVYEANSYRPDVLFGLMITAGIIVYAQGTMERPRLSLRVAGFAFLGLAMLAKGPLGLLLPGLVLVLWHAGRREWCRILELAPLSLVALAVFLPWLVATGQAMGWNDILHELYAQNFARFQSGARGHGQPPFYYIVKFWFDFAPWSWLVPPAVWWIVRTKRSRDRNVQLALWWFGTFLLFLSIAATKRQLYLLPAYPAVAILLGPWLASVGRPRDTGTDEAPSARPVRIYALALSVTFTIAAISVFGLVAAVESIVADAGLNEQELEVAHGIRLPLAVMGIALLMSGLWIGQAWRRNDARAALVRIGGTHMMLYTVTLGLVMPAFNPVKTYGPQSEWIRQQIGSETHIGMVWLGGMGRHKRGAFGYYTGAMVDLLDDDDQVEEFFRKYPGSVVLVHEKSLGALFAGEETAWRSRVIRELRAGNNLYFVLRGPQNPRRWEEHGQE